MPDIADFNPTLTAREMHQLWLNVPEDRRLAFAASLEKRCWNKLAAYQVTLQSRAAEQKPTQNSLASTESGRKGT